MKIAGKLSENEHTAQPLHDLYKEYVAELKEASELERKAASLLDEVEHVEELVGLEALTTGNEDNAQALHMDARSMRRQIDELVL